MYEGILLDRAVASTCIKAFAEDIGLSYACAEAVFFVVLYCNFRSLAFLGLWGFLIRQLKFLIFSYPSECSQVFQLEVKP